MVNLSHVHFALALILTAVCLYQGVYAVLKLLGARRQYEEGRQCRYAVLIAARNEQAVIGNLLDSIRAQNYPRERIDMFVVADNCTDATALEAAAHGAVVFERFDRRQVGKGYALKYLLEQIWENCPEGTYDGYFVFDADNLLDPAYISEMNKVFAAGNRVVTGCRNAKNFGDNWLTAGYGLYFLRESEYMNRSRDFLGVGCTVSGTGFLMADSLLRETGGWKWLSLSEDTEFTADMILREENIAYCPGAMLFDEQPTDVKVSITQRSRWIKGYLQVISRRGGELLRVFTRTGRFACYELLLFPLAATLCGAAGVLINLAAFFSALSGPPQQMEAFLSSALTAGFFGAVWSYLIFWLMGLLTLLTEWDRIRCPAKKKLLYTFAYPLFMASFLPAFIPAVFGRAQWKPIRHTAALSIRDISNSTSD